MTTNILRSFVLLATLALGAALLPSTLTAQQLQSVASGPRASQVGISNVVAASTPSAEAGAFEDSMGNGKNVAMMWVGGAAIVVGSLVGGDGGQIIAISGAVIGLIGLFHYLQ
ncbi:MAG: hypothetical protein ACYC0B_03065 [Gemmatimonadaceae bacterium]